MQMHRERAWTPDELDVRVVVDGAHPTVVVRGDVDLSNVALLAAALDTAVTKSNGSGIEVNLSETSFLSSSGITALLDAHVRLGQVPEAVVLRDPPPSVRRVLDLAGVTTLFTLRPTQPEPPPPPEA